MLTGLLITLLGCDSGDRNVTIPQRLATPPHEGASLTVSCDDPIVADELRRLAAGWSHRTGAKIDVTAKPDADVRIIPPVQLGAELIKEPIEVVPRRIMSTDHPLQLSRVLSTYRDRLTCWGSESYALPVAGEGAVLVYRTDRFEDPKSIEAFRSRFKRPLAPPLTYEDIAEIGEFFGASSLPPLPTDPQQLATEFNRVASCYDRPALVEGDLGKAAEQVAAAGNRILSFHHNIENAEPRLTTPGFMTAAKWFQQVQPHRLTATDPDPVAAISKGTTVVAILTMKELGRLPREGEVVSSKFGIMPLPGTRTCFDPVTGASRGPTDRATNINFIPYQGAASWIGIVRKKASSADAAFDFLADLATASRSSELLTDPKLGFGPFRSEHLDPAREDVYGRYGFDPERTKKLADALRKYASVTVANPVFAPRSPDQFELMTTLAEQVRRVARGEVAADAAMQQATEIWKKADAQRPPAVTAEWRRKTAGLN